MKTISIIKLVAIILCTGIIGGAIAFLGNQLGRFIGRKKLSIFGLRPRYTSMLITILTGFLIAALTLTIAVVSSEAIRIALTEREQLRIEIEKYKNQIRELLVEYREKQIVFRYRDIILSAVIDPETERKKNKDPNKTDKQIIEDALKELVANTNEVAIAKSKEVARRADVTFKTPPRGRLVQYIPENLDDIVDRLRRSMGPQIIFVRANHNAILGVNPLTVELGNPIPNRLIFRKGELITRLKLDGSKPRKIIANQLYRTFMEIIPPIAISRGMLPDPETNKVGEVELDQLADVINQIKKVNREVILDFNARSNTYILGPLELDIDMTPAQQ